jgi:hypothetical protein
MNNIELVKATFKHQASKIYKFLDIAIDSREEDGRVFFAITFSPSEKKLYRFELSKDIQSLQVSIVVDELLLSVKHLLELEKI